MPPVREPKKAEAPPPHETQPTAQGSGGRSLLIAVLVGLALLSILEMFSGPSARNVRYDQVKQWVREDRVAEIAIHSDTVVGRFRPGKAPPSFADGRAGEHATHEFQTARLEDVTLIPLLEQHRVRFSATNESFIRTQLPMLVWFVVLFLLVGLFWRMIARRLGSQAQSAMAFGKSRGRLVSEDQIDVTFDDVAGIDEAKEELHEIVEFLRDAPKFTRLGAKIPKGVLLVGPPGTGKTLLARAVAGEAKVPFFSLSGSEFVEMFVGVGASRVRDLFEQAKAKAPCIVFIDELDALGRSRAAGAVMGANEEREQTLNQLLAEMDGFEPNQGVIVMAATNRPEVLDPALMRPGRFDRQVVVDRPDRRGRAAILGIHARGVKLDEDVDLEVLAERTPGFAGADLANVINEAALLAARKGHELVRMSDVSEAIDRVIGGLERRTRVITPKEKERVAYHEVGHAIVAALVGSAERVHKISIVPRGIAALGYTMQLPTEDRYLMTESELRAKLAGLLGGRVAEQVVFGEVSTGAQNDLARATEIARAMVADYGMSDAVGPVALAPEPRAAFLGQAMPRSREFGEHLADRLDVEVRRLIEEAQALAKRVLADNGQALEKLAKLLLQKEYLDGEELTALLADVRRSAADRGLKYPDRAAAAAE